MDDVAEQQDVANEISEAISNPVGFGTDIDEVCLLWLIIIIVVIIGVIIIVIKIIVKYFIFILFLF